METRVCFYGYSGNQSLAVVSPFQLLQLLNPLVETKGRRYADTSSRRKPLGPRGAELRLGSETMSIQLSAFLSRRWHASLLLCGRHLWMLEFLIRLLQHTSSSFPPSSKKWSLLPPLGVEDLTSLTSQVPCGYTDTTPEHFLCVWKHTGVMDLRMQHFRILKHNGIVSQCKFTFRDCAFLFCFKKPESKNH